MPSVKDGGGDLVLYTHHSKISQIISVVMMNDHGSTFEGIVGAQLLAAWSPDMK